MPDSLLPILPSHDRRGASSISLTRSPKYVGWLLGSSIGPRSLYCVVSAVGPGAPVHGSSYPIAELVLYEELQGARLHQLLGLHGRLVVLEALVDGLAEDILELVVGAQVLLGPLGEDVGVDLALQESFSQQFGWLGWLGIAYTYSH